MNRTIFLYSKLSLTLVGVALLTSCGVTDEDSSPSASSTTFPSSSPSSIIPSNSASAHASSGNHEAHWGYEGAISPSRWSELSPEFKTCGTGKEQSPVDINSAQPKNLENLEFSYHPAPAEITNNGHTQQVNVSEGLGITVGDEKYELQQFHFHTPSEHTIDDKPAAAEVHFVHVNEEGELAVVAAFIRKGTSHQDAYQILIDNMQKELGDSAPVGNSNLDVFSLLPQNKQFVSYEGSLTTPPCTEGVAWYVLDTPVELSQEQIDNLQTVIGENARPVQNLNDRMVEKDVTP